MPVETLLRSAPTSPPPLPTAEPTPLRLEPALCCLCEIEDAEPVGVGEDFEYRTSPDTFLAVRCRRCGLVYLNPRPADSEAGRIYPDHYHAFDFRPEQFGIVHRVRCRLERRRLLNWCRNLPATARILDVGCGDGFHLRLLRDYGQPGWTLEGIDSDDRAIHRAREAGLTVQQGRLDDLDLPAGAYHLILLIMTVEHLTDPVGMLRSIRSLLAPGGRLVLVTDNAGSPDFALFGGRHWGGYHFPRHVHLFTKRTLRALAAKAGLAVESLATPLSPVNWVYSVRNWLDDWGAPRWLVNRFSLASPIALALFTMFDFPLSLFECGASLRATLQLPEESP